MMYQGFRSSLVLVNFYVSKYSEKILSSSWFGDDLEEGSETLNGGAKKTV